MSKNGLNLNAFFVSFRLKVVKRKNMKIDTWNINSVRLRIAQVMKFLKEQQPYVLCLQETKLAK